MINTHSVDIQGFFNQLHISVQRFDSRVISIYLFIYHLSEKPGNYHGI